MGLELRRLGAVAGTLAALLSVTTAGHAQGSADPHAAATAGTEAPDTSEGVEEANPRGNPHGNPHGGGNPHGTQGMFEAPEDGTVEDSSLPPGTITVHVADPAGKPLAQTPVTLGILFNSVAKGESRKRVAGTTDAQGNARFDGLEIGSEVAYRASVMSDGATFALPPFRLTPKAGMKGLLHVYPVVRDIAQSLVVTQSAVYAEVKDDRVVVQQAFTIYNFGKNAWVPNDLVVSLPEKFTAFTSQQGMSDVGVDAVPNKGARLRGTFSPGQHVIEFRWQLPYSGETEVRLSVGMPPHMAAARVITPASKGMNLEVLGFPSPETTNDGAGQRVLVTQKQLRREEAPLTTVAMIIKGLPSEGPGKFIATLLAAAGLVVGVLLGTKKPPARDHAAERARLLADLEDLERARQKDEIGPKTYERARRELLDALSRTFVEDAPSRSAGRRRRAAATAI